ncbi:MAG: bifunctional UDP-N-acetylglucosamine diphosphorylase/glucosamine-1-phosphate N-acetyltransferase GlmU [Actinomycetia bacterium]|nr:bifunctional UDP-N-acetylglucosamine diphosphorylase/glucosamine-1-phosphate N-acetyltransferase GlmU [Actinomycetes bacterium]
MTLSRPAAVIVLAAGEGTRMKSSTAKVLHMFLGRSLLGHVLTAAEPLEADHTVVIVGHAREAVTAHLSDIAPTAGVVVQAEQNGTGHAVRIALDELPDLSGTVMVVCGDTPLLTAETLHRLALAHDEHESSATVLTAQLANPTGYGRIVRSSDGSVLAIVEHRDADAQTLKVDEINSGIYVFDAAALRTALSQVSTDNSQGEEYLTDVIGVLVDSGARVDAVVVDDMREVMGVNDLAQLAEARSVMRDRINSGWMRAGVSIIDPATTVIGVGVVLEADAIIHPWTLLEGTTSGAAGAEVGPGSQIIDSTIGPNATVRFTTADHAVIGPDASVGPYTYLRPGTELGAGARAGAFVEAKNAQVGQGSKIPHLSYVGDAEIGVGSNIGAATVFVNYDGVAKHRTVIGDHVRIGSDTMLVAPVTIGDGAYTAAGSVITDDVPAGAMGVGRARQRTIRDWVLRKRGGSASARAAERAQQAAREQPTDDTAPLAGEDGRVGRGDGRDEPEGTGS